MLSVLGLISSYPLCAKSLGIPLQILFSGMNFKADSLSNICQGHSECDVGISIKSTMKKIKDRCTHFYFKGNFFLFPLKTKFIAFNFISF